MKVLVDADACPRGVKEAIMRLRPKYGYEILSVSSFNHVHSEEYHITVGDEDQAADITLLNKVEKGDIVVTQDWGVAAVACGKGAAAIDPGGRVFNDQMIDFLMEERHLKAKFRRGGGRTRGPAARTKEDDRRFIAALTRLLDTMI